MPHNLRIDRGELCDRKEIVKATACCYALMISRHANDDDCYLRRMEIQEGST